MVDGLYLYGGEVQAINNVYLGFELLHVDYKVILITKNGYTTLNKYYYFSKS